MLFLDIKKLNKNAIIPTYSKEGDAGMDLTVTSVEQKGSQVVYGFGLAIAIPRGNVGLIFPRSSIHKKDLSLANSVGVIDSGYRGELKAVFNTTGPNIYNIGDRAVQIVILPIPHTTCVERAVLPDSHRGAGGFGSTGGFSEG